MAVREMLTDGLTQRGFEVMPCETAEQAELRARDEAFDLLLTDIDLPGQNGAELAASLRAIPAAGRRADVRLPG
jgi:DNA-binding response OmpR family regulator